MTSCVCHVSAAAMAKSAASASAMAKLSASINPGNLAQLEAAAALPLDAKMDLSDALGLEAAAKTVPPSMDMRAMGALVRAAMLVKLTGANFNLFDPIKLDEQLKAMSGSLNNAAPGIKALASVKMSALAKITAMARAMIALKAAGLDPGDPNFSDMVAARATAATRIAHHKPKLNVSNLTKVRLIASIPTVLEAMDTMAIPMGGDNALIPAKVKARMASLAAVRAPAIQVKLAMVLKAAAVMDAKNTINEAFGSHAHTQPLLMARMNASLNAAAGLKLPKMAVPVPLPLPAAVKLGEQAANNTGFLRAKMAPVPMPKVAIFPPISANVALKAVLAPAPIGLCSVCGS